MGQELDFGSHVRYRRNKNIFKAFIHTIRASHHNVYGVIIYTQIKFYLIHKMYLGLSPSPLLTFYGPKSI